MSKFQLSFVPVFAAMAFVGLLAGCRGTPEAPAAPTTPPSAAVTPVPVTPVTPVTEPTPVTPVTPVTPTVAVTTPAEAPPAGARPGLGFRPDYEAGVEGVAVGGVTEGGPAAKAGIQEGDVIQVLNGIRVTDAQSYTEALDEQKVGATVPVQILRGSEKLELKVTIGTRRR